VKDPRKIQSEYYHDSAEDYDKYHASGNDPEHDISLFFLNSMIDLFKCKSVLDVGAGTGRAMLFLSQKNPNLDIAGIEPIQSLRQIAYSKGVSNNKLTDGDGYELNYPDGSFDIVCEFGILHHVERPEDILNEMLRVAKIGIFISDSNNYGQGNSMSKRIKWLLKDLGLWKLYNYCRTGGKRYQISKTDGLFYSYSVFNNYSLLKKNCEDIYSFNQNAKYGANPFKNSGHVAIFCKKKNH
jgi:ubiquinone/menaquinone biosynthesis C-methylase UbiE